MAVSQHLPSNLWRVCTARHLCRQPEDEHIACRLLVGGDKGLLSALLLSHTNGEIVGQTASRRLVEDERSWEGRTASRFLKKLRELNRAKRVEAGIHQSHVGINLTANDRSRHLNDSLKLNCRARGGGLRSCWHHPLSRDNRLTCRLELAQLLKLKPAVTLP